MLGRCCDGLIVLDFISSVILLFLKYFDGLFALCFVQGCGYQLLLFFFMYLSFGSLAAYCNNSGLKCKLDVRNNTQNEICSIKIILSIFIASVIYIEN